MSFIQNLVPPLPAGYKRRCENCSATPFEILSSAAYRSKYCSCVHGQRVNHIPTANHVDTSMGKTPANDRTVQGRSAPTVKTELLGPLWQSFYGLI